jgi:hypothetical protein
MGGDVIAIIIVIACVVCIYFGKTFSSDAKVYP